MDQQKRNEQEFSTLHEQGAGIEHQAFGYYLRGHLRVDSKAVGCPDTDAESCCLNPTKVN